MTFTKPLTELSDTELLDLLDLVSAEVKRRNNLAPQDPEVESFLDPDVLRQATSAFAEMLKGATKR